MRYPASEKLEIIRLVEQSHLPVKQTLAKIGVSRPIFYRWYDLYRRFGEAGLEGALDPSVQPGTGNGRSIAPLARITWRARTTRELPSWEK